MLPLQKSMTRSGVIKLHLRGWSQNEAFSLVNSKIALGMNQSETGDLRLVSTLRFITLDKYIQC